MTDDCPFRFIAGECPSCEGSGEVCVGSTHGTWYDPPEGIFETCGTCGGTGEREVEVEPIEMEDLDDERAGGPYPASAPTLAP